MDNVIAPLPPLLAEALPLLHKLELYGHQAYFVGGCVRDSVMDRPLADVDLATSALPETVMEIFPNSIPTGLAHGTVSVKYNGNLYEITTFRTESAYHDHRRPEEVSFIPHLDGDLLRRDFTINAMAVNNDGRIFDPYGGLQDLEKRVIRAVGNPKSRFAEDALRMLRAIRFASVFRFRISARTWAALREHAPLLRYVAMERVGVELDKMMAGPSPELAAALLYRSGLLAHTKEPLKLSHIHVNEGLHVPMDADADTRWAAACIQFGLTPQDGGMLFERLRYSRARRDLLMKTLQFHNEIHRLAEQWLAGDCNEDQIREAWVVAAISSGMPAVQSWLAIRSAAHNKRRIGCLTSIAGQASFLRTLQLH